MDKQSYESRLSEDLKQYEFRYAKLKRYENLLIDLTDNLLETVTALPICKNEYKNDVKKFEKYDRSYELLYDLLRLFEYYGVNVETPFSMTKPRE